MLVLTRKRDEIIELRIPPNFRGGILHLMVVDIRGDKVRLGVEAPRDVLVDRAELARKKGLEAACPSV